MVPRATAASLLALALLGVPGSTLPDVQKQEKPQAHYGSEITVALHTVVVRAVDPSRQPLLNLTREDFRVVVGKQEIPVVAVDWVSSSVPAAGPPPELPFAAPCASAASRSPEARTTRPPWPGT